MTDPHHGLPVLEAGEPLTSARAAMILTHGRGASAEDIMTIAAEVELPGFAYLAPQAAGNTWYPNPFTAPIASNEPYLSSALGVLEALLGRVEATIPAQRIVLLGFSQGACLALEFAARHARRYGGVAGLSGGLIGPEDTPRDYPGDFDGTPMFLGCSDVDPHIPKQRVIESGELFRRLGADVTVRLYPGMGHTVSAEEIQAVREIVESI
ncbi:MAG: dienelactone hydrolase family protein [Candidatus Dormiibacterota bacterium]